MMDLTFCRGLTTNIILLVEKIGVVEVRMLRYMTHAECPNSAKSEAALLPLYEHCSESRRSHLIF